MLRRDELRWMVMLTTAYVWAVGCSTESEIPFGEAGATTGTGVPTTTTSSAGGANAGGNTGAGNVGGTNAGGMGNGGDPAACGVVTCEADQACCTSAGEAYCYPATCAECCPSTMSTTTVTSSSSGTPTTTVTSSSSGIPTTTVTSSSSGLPTTITGVGGSFSVSGVGGFGFGGFGFGGFGSVSAVSGSGGGTPCGSLTCTSGFSCCTPANVPAYCYPAACTACCIQ